MTSTWSDYYPSKWLRAVDFDEPRIFTIARITREKVGKDDEKPVAFFKETPKGLILNKTNSEFLRTLSKSDNPDDCRGLAVLLAPVTIEFNGEPTAALRLRRVPEKQEAPKPKKPLAAELDDAIPF